MLDRVNPDRHLLKSEYKHKYKKLEDKLLSMQLEMIKYKIPVILCFEGWSASGKGTQINNILYPLDPRYYSVHTMDKVNEDTRMRPFLWAYWCKTPEAGRMAIFDKSYHRILLEQKKKWNLTDKEKEEFFNDVNNFEKVLADDGYVIIKFFLHMSKDEQLKRFEQLRDKVATSWRVDDDDVEQNRNYDEWVKEYSHLLKNTGNKRIPWHVIEANDKHFATVKIVSTMLDIVTDAINKKKQECQKEEIVSSTQIHPYLETVSADSFIEKEEYKRRLIKLQKKMEELAFMLYKKRKSVILVYEGFDAAGKGGNIKRVTQLIDPRAYEVISVPAPTREELNHHYLWRFWRNIPKDGHIAIFDRSWYGRVLVERLEGFCTKEEWARAFDEINMFEKNLVNHETIVLKFWIHIDKDEQLERFQKRMDDPLKNYKITDEDWRNRDKWDAYVEAFDEMYSRTNTSYAPWNIIPANSKQYARIKVLEIVVDKFEKMFDEIYENR